MTARATPVGAIVASSVTMGVAGDYLLRAPGAPGLNFVLLFAGVSGAMWLGSRRSGAPPGPMAAAWVTIGLLFALGLAWRGSFALRAIAGVCAATAFCLATSRAGASSFRRSGVSDLIETVAGAGAAAVFGGIGLIAKKMGRGGQLPPSVPAPRHPLWRSIRVFGRGLFVAVPGLVVFGALFVSADRVFGELMADLLRIDLSELISHVIATLLLAWLVAGYLSGFLTGTVTYEANMADTEPSNSRIGEVATALALIDLLFLAFVLVQFRYLFGGAELVAVTPGLTYAEYARSGFFELVTATALVIPWLLLADWLLGREARSGRTAFGVLAGVQLLLLLAVVASAFYRMRLYQEVFGFTELRFYVTVFLIWTALVVCWLAATVLRGKRERFAFGALVSGFAFAALLQLVNPDRLIVDVNLARAVEPASVERLGVGPGPARDAAGPRYRDGGREPLDVAYLNSLSSDTVPILLDRLDTLPADARCRVARRFLREWGPDASADWRSWNWSRARARLAIRAEEGQLRRAALGADESCA